MIPSLVVEQICGEIENFGLPNLRSRNINKVDAIRLQTILAPSATYPLCNDSSISFGLGKKKQVSF